MTDAAELRRGPMHRVRRRVKRLMRRLLVAWEAEARARARRRPILANVVLYESFAGNGALDNPEAIFRALLRAPDLTRLRHVWVLDGRSSHRAIRAEFARDRRVRFVQHRSSAYFRALSRAHYLINNATFPLEFQKREGQVYLNTWHGTPLKLMGYDMPNGAVASANTLRNFVAADLLLSQNSFMTERMYLGAYKLAGAFRGRILELGYPRVDRQTLDDAQRAAALARLSEAGVPIGEQRLVLYAPTWTGDDFSSPDDEASALVATVSQLQERLGSGYRVLLKTHQAVHHFARRDADARRVLVPNDIPTNVMLGLTDTLITDFSSIFFDFLALDRPIAFYVPPSSEYLTQRGAYLPADQLPGPTVRDVDALAEVIRSATPPAIAQRRLEWRDRFIGPLGGPTGDALGGASERVIDVLFRGAPVVEPSREVIATDDADRKRTMLIYLGGMRSNGITSSALNLLRAIDHDIFDVSILIARPRGRQQRANQALIDPRVRQFHRAGGMNGTKLRVFLLKVHERLRPSAPTSAWESRLWRDEWLRLFGDCRFDDVIDFSGYGRFWSQLLLHSPQARRSIWLHNDLAAEVTREVWGRQRMRRSLPAVFALYPRFDELVSVSPSLAEVNRTRLSALSGADPAAFVSARNLVDVDRVTEGAGHPVLDLEEVADADETPAWVDALAADDGTRWFVTVGRLSPEKNQTRLIAAFAQLHASRPSARLLIVGDGPLRAQLDQEVTARGLDGVVFLTGALSNPFAVMAAADCFVLSSNYEGQPMVLLEAAVVGLPIVTVDFGSVRDALPPEAMRVVEQSEAGLAAGMAAYLDGAVPPARFDGAAYNRRATREFERVVNGSLPDEDPTPSSPAPGIAAAGTATAG
ncbi:CDP-glycerol glycerophosphotransferase family protein [Lysinimonas soli]|uniref:CDP-glycerol glycerophosphotransferase family protein n=1 Tax=Lysinimonas soli TaxID=1074233 RepID=A0ABW0NSU1_9MICO